MYLVSTLKNRTTTFSPRILQKVYQQHADGRGERHQQVIAQREGFAVVTPRLLVLRALPRGWEAILGDGGPEVAGALGKGPEACAMSVIRYFRGDSSTTSPVEAIEGG